MKFYVAGFSSGGYGHPSTKTYGDALVYASDKASALTIVRQAGWIPNPGGIWLLGTETQRQLTDVDPDNVEANKQEAMSKGMSIIWSYP